MNLTVCFFFFPKADKSYPGICLYLGLSEMLGLLNSILLLFGIFVVRQGLSICSKLICNSPASFPECLYLQMACTTSGCRRRYSKSLPRLLKKVS
ncbi:mCG1040531, isoform CRA_b [Mus musculus]|nr:mCG1040531, isoform CRA_b [Mus musculus]